MIRRAFLLSILSCVTIIPRFWHSKPCARKPLTPEERKKITREMLACYMELRNAPFRMTHEEVSSLSLWAMHEIVRKRKKP